jgi:membrane protease subunit HflK
MDIFKPPKDDDVINISDVDGSRLKRAKKMRRQVIYILAAIFAVVAIASSFYTVNEQERAVVLTFGKPTQVVSSGLNFRIPFVQTVRKVNTTIQGFAVGYNEFDGRVTNDAVMITSDFNFVNIDFFVEWQVSDPVKALYASHRPVDILGFLVQSGARAVVGNTDIDSVLTTGKGEIQSSIREHVSNALDELNIGIRLVNVVIQDSEPPTQEVMAAFKSVENARQEKDTAVNNANRYRNEQIPNARAVSDQILQGAEAAKQARINEANGQVARFNEMYGEYIKNPEITRMRLFYEAMERIIPGVEVIIEGGGAVDKIYPVRSFMGDDNNGGGNR